MQIWSWTRVNSNLFRHTLKELTRHNRCKCRVHFKIIVIKKLDRVLCKDDTLFITPNRSFLNGCRHLMTSGSVCIRSWIIKVSGVLEWTFAYISEYKTVSRHIGPKAAFLHAFENIVRLLIRIIMSWTWNWLSIFIKPADNWLKSGNHLLAWSFNTKDRYFRPLF